MMTLILSLTVLFLLFVSGSFSSSEIAFFSLSKEKIRSWAHSSSPNEKMVSSLISKSRDLLVLIFFLNTFVNCLIQNISSSLFGPHDDAIVLKILLPFLCIFIFAEYLPKYIGLLYSEHVALRMAPFFAFCKRILHTPLQKITSLAENLSSILFFFLRPEKPMTDKDLGDILKTSQSIGLLTQHEALLVEHAMDLQNQTAQDELVPLSELPKVQISSLENIRELFLSTPYHIVVLVQGSSEKVLGIIDASNLQNDPQSLVAHAKSILTFVPETMHISRLISYLRQLKVSYGAVYDEHGKVIGIISAQIIRNNFLSAMRTPDRFNLHEQLTSEPFIFSASTSLESINDLFGTHLVSQHDQKTIGGWLTEILDTIPPSGTSCISHGLLFRVISSDEKRISRLFIQPIPTQQKEKTAHYE